MKTYNEEWIAVHGELRSEWVPAEVARGLYDALEWMLYEGSQTSDSEFISTRAKARLALSAADGEEV